MHPIDLLLQEYDITRYKFCKEFNLNKNRVSNIVIRNTPVDSLQVGFVKSLSIMLNKSIDEVYEKLKEYEEN